MDFFQFGLPYINDSHYILAVINCCEDGDFNSALIRRDRHLLEIFAFNVSGNLMVMSLQL